MKNKPNIATDDEIIESLSDREMIRIIMLVQLKQLFWIRIIGIPFLCSAVIAAIYMILLIFK